MMSWKSIQNINKETPGPVPVVFLYACAEDYLSEESVKINREFLDRFDSWADEMKSIVIASETGEPYEKDWEDFHKRGIELAHEYRKILPDNFDLWYSAPFEDKSGYIRGITGTGSGVFLTFIKSQ